VVTNNSYCSKTKRFDHSDTDTQVSFSNKIYATLKSMHSMVRFALGYK